MNRPLSKHCSTCGIRMIGQGEYTITVPRTTNTNNNLPALIEQINKQNLKDGYIKLRSEVEKEIDARNQPPPPAPQTPPKPKSVQQPQVPALGPTPPMTLPPSRKKPTTKACKNCAAQNPLNAAFCNACGKAL